jgi:ribonucleoside-diphosphate reductase beta chain
MGNDHAFGLDKFSFPFQLYLKSKRNGLWDPESIDFTQDRTDWKNMNPDDQLRILKTISMFYSGEQSVTDELIPLIYAVGKDGRVEETMYLTAFLFEEAKHAEFFSRYAAEVMQSDFDPHTYHSQDFRQIFCKALPDAMQRLLVDQSPEALAVASTTYHMVAENITAEISFHHFNHVFGNHGIMPGLKKGFTLIARDEGRHIGYGTYLLQRLITEHGDPIFEIIKNRLIELYPSCVGTVGPRFSHLIAQRMNTRLKIISKACTKELQEDVF